MSPILLAAGVAALLFLLALGSRRPVFCGIAGGLFLGPIFYWWLGGHLARAHGEGRFYSFPLGGYHLGDADVLVSVGIWMLIAGALSYAGARLLRRRAR